MRSPIHQPDNRAPREVKPWVIPYRDGTREERQLWIRERLKRNAQVIPDRKGTHEEKQLWMSEHLLLRKRLAGKRPDRSPKRGRVPVIGRKPQIHPRSAIAILAGMIDLNKALANLPRRRV